MDARLTRFSYRRLVVPLLAAAPAVVAAPPFQPVAFHRPGGGHRTENFVVKAPTPQLAREIGESAEAWREQLAMEWIGRPMPAWTEPCRLTAKVDPGLGAGGATTFVFDRGEVFGWEMEVQGSRERVLDSVLPHEVTHTVFASYFRKPLPRWADEGACTTVEHRSEVAKQERLLLQFLHTERGIPFSRMFAMKEYPRDILPLYAQGHSLCQYLIEKHGKQTFMQFLTDGMSDDNWRRAVRAHYGHPSLLALQTEWNDWVRNGRPLVAGDAATAIAASQPVPVRTTPRADPSAVAVATPSRPSVYSRASGSPPARASVYDAARERGSIWR